MEGSRKTMCLIDILMNRNMTVNGIRGFRTDDGGRMAKQRVLATFDLVGSRDPPDSLVHFGKVLFVPKADPVGDLFDRPLAVHHQLLSAKQPAFQQRPLRRHADGSDEHPRKMLVRPAGFPRDRFDRQRLCKILLHIRDSFGYLDRQRMLPFPRGGIRRCAKLLQNGGQQGGDPLFPIGRLIVGDPENNLLHQPGYEAVVAYGEHVHV
ncbi:hypothetical protein SAMN04487897_11058 [Paenibacillus sp. yr247]|nr:hypothetical protein [Paenibacillus sp. yr247]SDO23126.1 hypothetical protein SAMN04487897_11058 [Paenibacillus sp. yr247]